MKELLLNYEATKKNSATFYEKWSNNGLY